jgi:hypothetical protein
MKIKNRIFPTTSDVIYPSASLVVDAVGLAHPKSLNHCRKQFALRCTYLDCKRRVLREVEW